MSALLPEGFADLEPFVAGWAHADVVDRMAKRQSSRIEDIKAFYDALLPRGEAVLAYLRDFALGTLPPETERLLQLMLMLAEVAPAVEWYDDPMVYDGFPVSRLRFIRQIPLNAAQV